MGKMQVNCPFCNAALAAEYDWAGHTLECPDCHQKFTCPAGGQYYSEPEQGNPFVPPPPTVNPYNQNSYNQNLYNQNPYNQNSYNQNPYNQNPYNQNPYNQNPYNQNPYNQNPYNQSFSGEPRATMFTALQKYAQFYGRASRREYWLFVIFNQLVQFCIGFICGLCLGYSDEMLMSAGGLVLLFSLFTLIPGLAVGVRRCHDTGRSGWWLLIALVPCVGAFILLFILCLPSNTYDNQYGPNPNGAYPDEAWPVVVGIVLMVLCVLLS